MLEAAGADFVFAPSAAEMYPEGFATALEIVGADDLSEGASRPGFFAGVATVCAKLFNVTSPDVAFFGQKDAQQCITVKRLVKDMAFPLEIYVCATTREADGLAMSSRNTRLTATQRAEAPVVFRALLAGKELAERWLASGAKAGGGGSDSTGAIAGLLVGDVVDAVHQVFSGSDAVERVHYVTLANPTDGTELGRGDRVRAGAVLSTAVYLKGGDPVTPVRLIDNVIIAPARGDSSV
jgi:pantoate--beta-alanine ligase